MYTLVSFNSDTAMFCVLGEEMVVLSPLLHPHLRDGGHWGSRPPVSINQELFIPSLTGGDQLTGCQGGQLTEFAIDTSSPLQAAQVHLLPRGKFSCVGMMCV